jgi:hypothetical protein
MKPIQFRVEVNNGSKYFTNSQKAIDYYNTMKNLPMTNAQMWKFLSPTQQELVAPLNDPKK